MSIDKSTKKKLATGAVLVALSGFVPQPSMQRAFADSATMTVKGSFSDGIVLANGTKDLNFGVIVPTGGSGNVNQTAKTTAAPTQTFVKGFQNAGTVAGGNFSFLAQQGSRTVDITLAGLGKVTLGGATPTGTVSLVNVQLAGPFATAQTLVSTGPADTTDKATVVLNNKTTSTVPTDIIAGGKLAWGATLPVGTFTQTVTLTIAY